MTSPYRIPCFVNYSRLAKAACIGFNDQGGANKPLINKAIRRSTQGATGGTRWFAVLAVLAICGGLLNLGDPGFAKAPPIPSGTKLIAERFLPSPIEAGEQTWTTWIVEVFALPEAQEYKSAALDLKQYRADEIECLALNIYFEARGEVDSGKHAVAHVVMNRVADPGFPATVCSVIRQGKETVLNACQFSWWCDGRSDIPRNRRAWTESVEIAEYVYEARAADGSGATEDDMTGGALWYHADHVSPTWSLTFALGPKIGNHIFYHKGDGQVASRKLRTQVAMRTPPPPPPAPRNTLSSAPKLTEPAPAPRIVLTPTPSTSSRVAQSPSPRLGQSASPRLTLDQLIR